VIDEVSVNLVVLGLLVFYRSDRYVVKAVNRGAGISQEDGRVGGDDKLGVTGPLIF
jgi:hypothetical protein